RQGRQRLPQRLGQTHGLLRDAAKLGKEGGLRIGLIVLLRADALDGYEAAVSEPREFALYRAGAAARQPDQLGGEETALRLAEQIGKHALLRRGKQRVGQARARWSRRRYGFPVCGFHTHFGHLNTHFGHIQVRRNEDAAPPPSWPGKSKSRV